MTTDILSKILLDVPHNWNTVSAALYGNSYFLVTLHKDSLEYDEVVRDIRHSREIDYVARVQNPFQLGLFKIMKERRSVNGESVHTVTGYHIVLEPDIETALKYTVDYRRYSYKIEKQNTYEKQPYFYTNISDAISALDAYMAHGSAIIAHKGAIIVCEVMANYADIINCQTQGDYLANYVIYLT